MTTRAIGPDSSQTNREFCRLVGARLRSWRRCRGLTQERLALLAGVNQASISNYEKGKRDIPLPALLRLVGALDIGVRELLPEAAASLTPEVIVPRDSRLGAMIERVTAAASGGLAVSEELAIAVSAAATVEVAVRNASRSGADVALAAVVALNEVKTTAITRGADRELVVSAIRRSAVRAAREISPVAASRVAGAIDSFV